MPFSAQDLQKVAAVVGPEVKAVTQIQRAAGLGNGRQR